MREAAARELLDRCYSVTRDFARGLELGGGGAFARLWAQEAAARAKIGWLATADLAETMLGGAVAPAVALDEERLAVKEASLDLVVSPLSLHGVNDLPGALVQIRRALRPDGLFVGALFGAGTLAELREALLAAEIEASGGAGARIAPFPDVRDLGALLQRAGFALPVADVDRIVVRYAAPARLLFDLRAMGETSALASRPEQPLTRGVLERALSRLGTRADADGRVPATFEIVTLTGWAPHPGQPKPLAPGSAKARLADALGVRERTAGEKAGPARDGEP